MYHVSMDGKTHTMMTGAEIEAGIKAGTITKTAWINPTGDPEWYPIDTFFTVLSDSRMVSTIVACMFVMLAAWLAYLDMTYNSDLQKAIIQHNEVRAQVDELESEVTSLEKRNAYR